MKTSILLLSCTFALLGGPLIRTATAETIDLKATSLPAIAPSGGVRLMLPESTDPAKLGTHISGGLKHQIDTEGLLNQDADHGEMPTLALTLFDQPRNTWDASASVKTDLAISKDDHVLIGFWVRGTALNKNGNSVQGDGGVVEVVFEKRSPPHTKSVQYLVETEANNVWKHVWVRCDSKEDYKAGESGVGFQIGYSPQRIEIAGVEVWKYPARTPLNDLPMSPRSYIGREADAQWRVAANQRIEQHRKCDLLITIVDTDGKPLTGQKAMVKQTKHAFQFGTAASVNMIARQDEDGRKYREELKRLFNIVTIENGLKWKFWDKRDVANQAKVLSAIDWCNQQGVSVRGHVLVWPAQKNSPDWISSLYDNPKVLKKVVNTHIREMGYATQGRVTEWDVLNEAFDNQEFEKHLGPKCFTEFFQEARGVLPDADLYYNDYAGLVRAGVNTYHKDHFEMIIQRLIDEGAPIDGIGIQGHFGEILTPPHRIVRELDRWGKFGLKIMITEFDAGVPDQDLMADFTADFLTACFSHPDVDGIVTWGFWAGAHWRPHAALLDKQWQPTPLGKRWIDLTNNQWMTNETTTLDQAGSSRLRVFKGEYQITAGGQTWNVTATEDREITLTLNAK